MKVWPVNWQIPGWPKIMKVAEWKRYQNAKQNVSLTIEEFLKIKNGSQYANDKKNNLIKNKIYPKISHNASLWIDCTIWQSQCHQGLCHYYHATLEGTNIQKT